MFNWSPCRNGAELERAPAVLLHVPREAPWGVQEARLLHRRWGLHGLRERGRLLRHRGRGEGRMFVNYKSKNLSVNFVDNLWSGEGNIMAVGEEYNVGKSERGFSNIIFPVILRLLARISSGEEGKGTEIMGKKIEIKKWIGEEYQAVRNDIPPWFRLNLPLCWIPRTTYPSSRTSCWTDSRTGWTASSKGQPIGTGHRQTSNLNRLKMTKCLRYFQAEIGWFIE